MKQPTLKHSATIAVIVSILTGMTAQPIHAVLPERAWRAEEIFTEPDTLMLQELKEMPLSIKNRTDAHCRLPRRI